MDAAHNGHADGLILEVEDLPSLVLSRRGSGENYGVGSLLAKSASGLEDRILGSVVPRRTASE